MAQPKKPQLSSLENRVMHILWGREKATAEDVRVALAEQLKDSTVRTILRRLEQKGYVRHVLAGRTYVYSAKVAPQGVAVEQVRGIIERFCDGSVENLLVGMVDSEVVSAERLKRLAEKIAKAEAAQKRRRRSPGD